MGDILRYLRRIMRPPDPSATGSQLLDRFCRQIDESAFESLVHRHGPMVLGICRRVLGNEDDAEDAFQAVFLILARKAASIRTRAKLKNWLYGVACRTALEARRARTKRRAKEAQALARSESPNSLRENELRTVLDEEIARLPAKYQEVIVLCDLEGMARKEAAEQLGCPQGTIASRLARARGRLAKRLDRRGFGPSAGTGVGLLVVNDATASLSPSWVNAAVRAVNADINGRTAAAGGASDAAIRLAEGAMKKMLPNKLKMATAAVLILGALSGGTVALSYRTWAEKPPPRDKKTVTSSDARRVPMVRLWQERAVLKDHGDLVTSVAFAPKRRLLATAGLDGAVKLWEMEPPRVKATLQGHETGVLAVAFSPDGKTLAAAGRTGGVKLWDVESEKERATWTIDQHLVSLAFSPDGKSVATGDGFGISLWDTATGKERTALKGSRRNSGSGGIGLLARPVAFSPDGRLLAAGYDRTVKLWDLATGKEQPSFEGHKRVVFSLSFSPDGKTLLSGSGDGNVRLWDVATGKEKAVLLKEARWLLAVAFAPDGRTVAAGFRRKGEKNYQVTLWDAKSGKEQAILKGYGDEGIVSLAFSPDGKWLATACGDFYSGRPMTESEDDTKKKGEIRLWQLISIPAKK